MCLYYDRQNKWPREPRNLRTLAVIEVFGAWVLGFSVLGQDFFFASRALLDSQLIFFALKGCCFFVVGGLLPNFGLTPEKCGKETFSIELN